MGNIRQKVRRVYEDEKEYDERTDINAEFDDQSDEWFKVIICETDEELELRLVESNKKELLDLIGKTRDLLNQLAISLDIYNTKGLDIIANNMYAVVEILTSPSVK